LFKDGDEYSTYLANLHSARESSKAEEKLRGRKRQHLTGLERDEILKKNGFKVSYLWWGN